MKKAFSLIELLVVVAIICILGAIVVPLVNTNRSYDVLETDVFIDGNTHQLLKHKETGECIDYNVEEGTREVISCP